ncbi:hypothetical protein [Sphingomonas changnyeongensis]|uniref:hypothetical protein n=1 Tax=Sphingomonas changnyeongensis TaxID=2698679 RepID=UPI001E2DC523|nr:hypothetical protein [Sphingomonas changnyeongensis]
MAALLLTGGTAAAYVADGGAQTPAQAFGALPAYSAADLSPDGLRLSYLGPRPGGGNTLFVVDLAGAATPVRLISATGQPELIEQCHWIAATRLACRIAALTEAAGYVVGATRWIALDADGGNLKVISERPSGNAAYFSGFGGEIVDFAPGTDGSVLMVRWHVPDNSPGTIVKRTAEGYSLGLVDTRTLKSRSLTPRRSRSAGSSPTGAGSCASPARPVSPVIMSRPASPAIAIGGRRVGNGRRWATMTAGAVTASILSPSTPISIAPMAIGARTGGSRCLPARSTGRTAKSLSSPIPRSMSVI